jgi:amino acid permease
MPSDDAPVFSRENVQGGMPARRASTLLYAIENRTALLAARARRAMARFETERTAAEKERLFFGALADGRTPAHTTIQDLDRFAGRWASLVPDDPELRAAVLARVVEKYGLPAPARDIRAALGAGDAAVAAAYRRQTGLDLGAIHTHESLRERFRWWRTGVSRRLEDLPPFWLAYALTLTETVGGGILALPIAFAGFGPVGAAGLLVVFGVINALTVAALVESITRNGNMRYGNAYFGRLIADFLGRPGTFVAMPALFALDAVGFLVALVAFGTTMAGMTGLPVVVGAAILFTLVAATLWRGSFDATVALAVGVGIVNLVLILLISFIALANARPDAFATGASVGVAPGASILELIFGVVLVSYFGHTSAGHAAKVVLAKDPSGRQLLSGNVAAMLTAMAIYILFVIAVTAAVGAAALDGYQGTALTPLAARVGPIVDVLGSVFIVLGVGLSSIYLGLGIFNQMAEVLPSIPGVRWQSRPGRPRMLDFVVRASPLAAIFAIADVLVAAGTISFTGPLSLIGTLALTLLAGVFPMLMLLAARRRGDRLPGRIVGPLGQPVVALAIGSIFFVAVLSFGLWIWDGPLERIAALSVAAAIIALTVSTWRNGAFEPRAVLEYRVEAGPPDIGILSLMSDGRPLVADIRLEELTGVRQLSVSEIVVHAPDRLRAIGVVLPDIVARELTLWIHAVGSDGSSTASSPSFDGADAAEGGVVGTITPRDGPIGPVVVDLGAGSTRLSVSMASEGAPM